MFVALIALDWSNRVEAKLTYVHLERLLSRSEEGILKAFYAIEEPFDKRETMSQ